MGWIDSYEPENILTTNTKTLALLIGIDKYSEVALEDQTYFPSLHGCVRDVELIEELLRSRFGVTDENIIKLVSRHEGPIGEDQNTLPTHQNLVNAFKSILDRGGKGDQIFIHYSGHGGRSRTIFRDLKGLNGLDESLVPCDIGSNGPCFLRDVEIAYLIKSMSEKGLIVTMVLDSCHSGGATRGTQSTGVRGIESIYSGPVEENSQFGSIELLSDAVRRPETARSIVSGSGWLFPTPPGFVLLAACAADELANEFAFNGADKNGALSFWFLDAIRQMSGKCTYRMIHRHVLSRIHSRFSEQTPQLEGDGDRTVFGQDVLPSAPTILVTGIDAESNAITLNAGTLHGVSRGVQFTVFPNAAAGLATENKLAVVEAAETDGTTTVAILRSGDVTAIEPGMQAMIVGLPFQMRSGVFIDFRNCSDEQRGVLDLIKNGLAKDSLDQAQKSWLRLTEHSEAADLQVGVDEERQLTIRDCSGYIFPNLRPIVQVNDVDAPRRIIERLNHLSRYRNVSRITNTNPSTSFSGGISAELGTLIPTDGGTSFVPFAPNRRLLSDGQNFCVRVQNRTDESISFAILNLRPDWSIVQIHPVTRDSDLIEPGGHFDFTARAALSIDGRESTEMLKIFASNDEASFKCLQMAALDKPLYDYRSEIPSKTALQNLMHAFAGSSPTRDIVSLATEADQSWTTVECEISIRRATIAHVEDPALSLLQSAFDETIATSTEQSTRSYRGNAISTLRPESQNPIIREISQYCLASDRKLITDEQLVSKDIAASEKAQERGILDVPKYCAGLAVGLAREWFNARVLNNSETYDSFRMGLEAKFGTCDTKYITAMTQFIEFLRNKGHVPYREPNRPDDFVIEGRLPSDATIGVVADWATGEPEALEVLRQVEKHSPNVAAHLGDIYYSGTEFEVENYFYRPWTEILGKDVLSLAVPGNHDLYAGGEPFYQMLDRLAEFNNLGQRPASYFCLRNDDWQLIGLDTALNDRLIGPTTRLQETELEWLVDKISNRNGRKTVLLSHHQLFSANDQFDGRSYNEVLYGQVRDILPYVDLWLWGHEHDLVIFDSFMGLKRGRCIGGSAYPVGNFEMANSLKNLDVTYNRQVSLSKGKAFHHHCYVVIRLNGKDAVVEYYEDRRDGTLLWSETL